MSCDPSDTVQLVRRVRNGDPQAMADLFCRHRERLLRMIGLRLDPRLQGRMDHSDVVQDVYLEASRRLGEHLQDPRVPFFVWLRSIAAQKLIDLHRRHLGAKARDPRREVSLERRAFPVASSALVAVRLLGKLESPSKQIVRAELRIRLQEVIDSMDPKDREVLILRHFEQLTNTETAHEMSTSIGTASKRYIRAVKKLKDILSSRPGPGWETWIDAKN